MLEILKRNTIYNNFSALLQHGKQIFMKMKLYKINVYQSYIPEEYECGITWVIYLPSTIYYKYEILEEVEIELPEGVERKDLIFLSSDHYCIMINEKDYTVFFASSDRITNWFNPSALLQHGKQIL